MSYLLNTPNLPTLHVDTHFARVPQIEEVRFDAERCAELLTHPELGIAERDLSRIHFYLRPDYDLAYTRKERKAARLANPDDYTDAARCEMLDRHSRFGNTGDVLITIVYGAGFSPNKLLCHEAVHAHTMLDRNPVTNLKRQLIETFLPKRHEHADAAEEARADAAMENIALSGIRKGIIKVIRSKI